MLSGRRYFNLSLTFSLTIVSLLLAFVLSVAGCRQKMADQPKYKPLAPSTFFDNGQSSRPVVPGTVPRQAVLDDTVLLTGKIGDAPADIFPFPITLEVLHRGQERFNIYCAPCHDRVGSGAGMIVRRGYSRAASFHSDTLRVAPVGHFFDVITQGFGAMPSYAAQVTPRDRWAIIAYIRALQLSQHAQLADVPPDEQQQLPTHD